MKSRKMISAPVILLALGAGLILSGPAAQAEVPNTIAFQGYLTDSAGVPLNGTVSMVLSIYSQAGPGVTPFWTETQPSVTVTDGVFAVALGAVTPLDASVFNAPSRFVGIRVNGEAELPRTELRATPFAFQASEADSVKVGINLLQGPVSALRSRHTTKGTDLEWRNTDNGRLAAQLGAGVGSEWGAPGHGALALYDVTSTDPRMRAGLFALDAGIAPSLWLEGDQRDVIMFLGFSEDASVQLPASAISSPEMADEPGVASVNNTNLVTLSSATPTSVISRTITAPSAGYVLALGQSVARITHTGGTGTSGAVGLSDDGVSFGTAQDVNVQISSGAAGGSYAIPVHTNGVFPVTGGEAKTIHIVATEVSGDIQLEDLSLTLVFLPTSYGTVMSTLMAPGNSGDGDGGQASRGPQTPAEIAAEREESQRWNVERIEREVTELAERARRLEREMEAARAGTGR